MSAPLSVAAVGAYAPAYRVEAETVADAWGRFEARGVDRTAVPAADEDALTMAVAAAERALAAGEADAADLESLALASTTPPVAEEDLTARFGSMLGVGDGAGRQWFGGSTRAGTRALAATLDAGEGPALVVAGDCPRGEPADARDHAAGAGAAALLLTADGGVAVSERAEYAAAYPGTRFREAGSERVDGLGVTSYDRRAFTETVAGAVDRLRADPGEVEAAAVQSPDGDLPYRAGRAVGLETAAVAAGTTVADLGDTGAASPLLGLSAALAGGAESVLLVGYGSGGGADAFLLDGSCPVRRDVTPGARLPDGADASLDYAGYLRRRDELTPAEPDGGGAYVPMPAWRRSLPQRHRLVAGQCPACGALAFPPEGACRDCRGLVDYDSVRLPAEGTVETATVVAGGAPPEFAGAAARGADLGVVLAAFEREGRSVTVPLQTVAEAGAAPLEAGAAVGTAVRRLYTQEGVVRYARKAVPAGE